MDTVDTRSHQGRTVIKLIQNRMSFIAAHTNWDSAKGGINDTLANMFGLNEISDFGLAAEVKLFKLVVTSPHDSVEPIIDAASEAGAGVISAYSRCAFITSGRGTFLGDETTSPTIGASGRQESVDEARIEMLVPEDRATAVERAVRKVHPYEEPAYDTFTLRPKFEQPCGRVGALSHPMKLREFAKLVDNILGVRSLTWGDPERTIKRVGFVGGAADSEWMNAQRAGADILVTGEVKQHIAVEATESGMTLIAAGHYNTEHPGCMTLRDRLQAAVPDVEWLLFTPVPGLNGRPF